MKLKKTFFLERTGRGACHYCGRRFPVVCRHSIWCPATPSCQCAGGLIPAMIGDGLTAVRHPKRHRRDILVEQSRSKCSSSVRSGIFNRRVCRPYGACGWLAPRFYRDVAPTALGRRGQHVVLEFRIKIKIRRGYTTKKCTQWPLSPGSGLCPGLSSAE
jgi:hypothetical protein